MSEETTRKTIQSNKTRCHNKQVKTKLHLCLNGKILISAVLFVLFFALTIIFAINIVEKDGPDPINYNERGVIDYKVFLKENDFYSEEFLPKGRSYVANLISYIDADVNYIFRIDEKSSVDFEYKIISELVIENPKGTSRYFEKKYDLTEIKEKKLKNGYEMVINDHIKVDYNEYNQLANKFRSVYGIESNSYLKIYVSMTKKTDENATYPINESNNIEVVKIPLSERAIEININSSESTITKEIVPTKEINYNIKILAITILFFIFSFYFLIKLSIYIIQSIRKTNKYDKYINKILRDYDRLIVEINTNINFNEYNIIKVKKFSELLDVRDNLKLPINYYVIEPHKKGLFYIKCNEDVYMLIISDNDLDKRN